MGMILETNKICTFAAKHFNVHLSLIYSHSTTDECSIARYMIWYYLHYELGASVAKIAKDFNRTKRAVFAGLSKIRNGIKKQKFYKDIYTTFKVGYEKTK